MALKREDLEELIRAWEDSCEADASANEKLQVAAPALALACLNVLACFEVSGVPIVRAMAECDQEGADQLQASYDRLPVTLREALEAAGVEVP